MNNQELATDTMNKIKVIQSYIDKYGKEDTLAYYRTFGTWRGFEDYLNERMIQRQAKETETT